MRRYAAFDLCFLLTLWVGLPARPAAPVSVCRMTGQPMTPPPAGTVTHRPPCCTIEVLTNADGSTGYTLQSPGCCDLHQVPEWTTATYGVLPLPSVDAGQMPPSPMALVFPPSQPLTAQRRAILRRAAPRAPPIRDTSPRGPPFFS